MTQNNKNNKNVKIISIESRKGGVGKTTIGFVLSKILIDIYKYNVIFLDLDIAGTSAGDAAESLNKSSGYFKDSFSIASKKNKRLNLVEMFENYMTGPINNRNFQWVDNAENNTNCTLLHKKKINVISSYLAEGYNEEQIFRPENIFDEFHSIWFIQMIKELIELWSQLMDENDKKLVVIIDNSPGHSGFEPAIEDWLTDQSPEIGKFLSVATPDSMDIYASIKSMMELHNLYFLKCETATLVSAFLDGKNSADENEKIKFAVDMTKRDRLFFHKLAEVSDNSTQEFKYYFDASTNVKDKPHNYLAMIINKVSSNPLDIYSLDVNVTMNVNKIIEKEKLANNDKFKNYFKPLFSETGKNPVPFSWDIANMYSGEILSSSLALAPGVSQKSLDLLKDIVKSYKIFTIKLRELRPVIQYINDFQMFISSEIYRCSEFDNIMNIAFEEQLLPKEIFNELLFKNENQEAFYKLKKMVNITDLQNIFIADVAFDVQKTEEIVKDILQNLEQTFDQCLFTLKTQTNIKFFGFWCRIMLYAVATNIPVNIFYTKKDSILKALTNILSEIVKLSMEMSPIFGADDLSIADVNWLEIADKYKPKKSQGKKLPSEIVHAFGYNQAKTLDSYKLLESLIIQFIKINLSDTTDKDKYVNIIKELFKNRTNSAGSYQAFAAFKASDDVYALQRYASDQSEQRQPNFEPMIKALKNVLSTWGIST